MLTSQTATSSGRHPDQVIDEGVNRSHSQDRLVRLQQCCGELVLGLELRLWRVGVGVGIWVGSWKLGRVGIGVEIVKGWGWV